MISIQMPLYATLALCAGPIMFWRGFRDLRIRRLIQNTPTARIRSMAMGLVEVKGEVLERSTTVAPFSGQECAYWEVDIAVRTRRNNWTTVHRNSSGNPFFISDGTGIALVYPQGSRCKVTNESHEECAGISLPECYDSYLKTNHLWQRWMWKLSLMRFRERRLEDQQQVFVLGSAEPRTLSRDISAPDEIAATDGVAWLEPEVRATGTDGAWTASSDVPSHIPPRGPGRVKQLHDCISAVIRRGEHESTFLISSESETAIETSLVFSTLGSLAAGPVLTVIGLGYWLVALSGHWLVP